MITFFTGKFIFGTFFYIKMEKEDIFSDLEKLGASEKVLNYLRNSVILTKKLHNYFPAIEPTLRKLISESISKLIPYSSNKPEIIRESILHKLKEIKKLLSVEYCAFIVTSEKDYAINEFYACPEDILVSPQKISLENQNSIPDILKKNIQIVTLPISDFSPTKIFDRNILSKQGLESVFCIPIFKNEQVCSFFCILAKDKKFQLEVGSTELLKILGNVFQWVILRKNTQEELRRNEALLREAQRAAGLGFWEWDLPAKKVTWSDETYAIYKHPRNQPVSEGIWEKYAYPEDEQIVRNILKESLLGKRTYSVDYRIIRNDRELRYIHSEGKVIFDDDNRPLKMFGIIMDITQRKNAENTILESQKTLEMVNKKLRFSNKELQAFVYSISHDLQAQIRRIKGFTKVLLEDYTANFKDEGNEYLKRIWNNVNQLKDFTDGLLRLSRITITQKSDEIVDLGELAKDIYNNLQEAEPDRNVELKIAQNLTVHGDPPLLRIFLENLLNNAWKFTSNEKYGVIELGIVKELSDQIYFIKDNGIGFDMKKADGLFNIFRRLSSSNEFEGIGIGLATAKRIIQRHKGKIWAESELGKGATFFFTLKT